MKILYFRGPEGTTGTPNTQIQWAPFGHDARSPWHLSLSPAISQSAMYSYFGNIGMSVHRVCQLICKCHMSFYSWMSSQSGWLTTRSPRSYLINAASATPLV